jgi:hypothetical protein
MRAKFTLVLIAVYWFFAPQLAWTYPVGPSLSLEALIEQADLICKCTVLKSAPVEDPWFEKVHGFLPYETRLKIITVFKGAEKESEITFRHYGPGDEAAPFVYMPQWYRFERGRSYLLFAARGERKSEYRQLWKQHKAQEDQGLVLAANAEARPALNAREAIWEELIGLLGSDERADVKYALSHLNAMSGGDYREMADFDRKQVLEVIVPLAKAADIQIAQAAIGVLGSSNPYMSQDFAAGWLATVGQGHIPGHGAWDRDRGNLAGQLYWQELAAVVKSDRPAEVRALAIRALGRGGAPEVRALAETWILDSEPQVRGAAAVLLADYPREANTNRLKALCRDEHAVARRGAAQGIGFGQFSHLLEELGTLLQDKDGEVSTSAALSLLSFPLTESHGILKAHRDHPQFHPLFINALAQDNAAAYLDELCEIVKKDKQPENWWGGFVPWGDSWKILMAYAQSQPLGALKSPKLTKVLDALEHPASGDPNAPKYYSSSEPRDLYAFYRKNGLYERATAFRAACKKALTYDIEYYFNMVDGAK